MDRIAWQWVTTERRPEERKRREGPVNKKLTALIIEKVTL